MAGNLSCAGRLACVQGLAVGRCLGPKGWHTCYGVLVSIQSQMNLDTPWLHAGLKDTVAPMYDTANSIAASVEVVSRSCTQFLI